MNDTKNLLIDDSDQLQRNIESEKAERDIDITFPNCPKALEKVWSKWSKFNFQYAVIDFQFNDWDLPIKLDDNECRDGVDVAQQISLKYPETQIGMYSSHMSNLKEKLDRHEELYEKMHLIELEPKQATTSKKIFNYIAAQKISIRPLNKDINNIPRSLQVALNKYISEPRNKGEHIWKVGDYLWHASINQRMSDKFDEYIENLDKGFYTYNNKIKQYMVGLDENDLFLKNLSYNGKIVNFNLTVEEGLQPLPYNLDQYLFVKNKCEKYINGEFEEKDLVHFLSSSLIYDEYKLECQNILFKKFKNKDRQLKLERFPFILDIFEGRVDKVVNDDAYIILKNLLNKSKVKIIKVKTNYLKYNNLEEDSEFEYIVYENSIGQIVPNIEPYIID